MWKRLSRMMRSFVGFFISAAENPEIILEQNIRDMNDQVPRMNDSIAMVKANVTLLAEIRSAKPDDCDEGIRRLEPLLDLLPKLRAVVFFGKTAQRAAIHIANKQRYQLFESPHPSPQSINRVPGNREKIITVLREVAKYLDGN